jgi:predicted dithiol-disulfide oxidoreductase (DUF899 family)
LSACIFSPFIEPEQSAITMKCSGRLATPPPASGSATSQHLGSQTRWPGLEDSATTAHIENEAVSEYLNRVRRQVRYRRMYQWLDRAPRGRNETRAPDAPLNWYRRHDEYDNE